MTHPVRCAVEIPAIPKNTATSWTQVAYTGRFEGYANGPFSFTPQTFADCIRNLHEHPQFVRGADGFGCADCIPFDIGHSTDTTPGNAPAVGWCQDLETRPGPQGQVQLWAKVRWLPETRAAILAGRYRWASVVVLFDARDPETNENVGAVLTSIAITNTPFLENLAPLVAASKQASQSVSVKRVIVKLPYGVSRNSPQGRAILAQLARRLSTPVKQADPDAADDNAPATPEEQELMAIARAQAKRALPAPTAKLDATGEPGRNRVERTINCMRRHVSGFDRLSWDEQCSRASDALLLGVVNA